MRQLLFFFLFICPIISKSQTLTDSLKQDDSIFTKVDSIAQFESGKIGWRKFLQGNLNANTPIENAARDGKYVVILNFIVHKDGSVTDIKAQTSLGYGLENECIRVMKKSPNWIPAILNGKSVTSLRQQPFTFIVESK